MERMGEAVRWSSIALPFPPPATLFFIWSIWVGEFIFHRSDLRVRTSIFSYVSMVASAFGLAEVEMWTMSSASLFLMKDAMWLSLTGWFVMVFSRPGFDPFLGAFGCGYAKTGWNSDSMSTEVRGTASTCRSRVRGGTSTLCVSGTASGSERQFGTVNLCACSRVWLSHGTTSEGSCFRGRSEYIQTLWKRELPSTEVRLWTSSSESRDRNYTRTWWSLLSVVWYLLVQSNLFISLRGYPVRNITKTFLSLERR